MIKRGGIADVRKAALTPVGDAVVGLVHHELVEEGLPLDTFGELKPVSVILAKTASRVVLGYMNEMAKYCEDVVNGDGGLDRCDVRSLNRGLRLELHLSRQPPGYIVPIDVVHARLSRIAPSETG